MNFELDLEEKNKKLLQEIGYKIENREYSPEEIKQCLSYISNHIMSKSSKNGDMSKAIIKFNDLINILVKYESKDER